MRPAQAGGRQWQYPAMNRAQLRAISHIIAVRLFERHGSQAVPRDAIDRELALVCAESRNSDMTQSQRKQAAELFIRRDLARLARLSLSRH
jgi:hypothetical protein